MNEFTAGMNLMTGTQTFVDFNKIYRDLVKEAYITPIRTVVVVDDEFPTLDRYVETLLQKNHSNSNEEKKYDLRNVEIIKNLLNYSRADDRYWLVDIFDGGKINFDQNFSIPKHLQHSDLMILDYHLKGDSGTGEDAIKILRMLAESNHFNMVAIYTKGHDGEIGKIFNEVIFALFKNNIICDLTPRERETVNNVLDEFDNIFEELIDDNAFLLIRSLIDSAEINKFSQTPAWIGFFERLTTRLGRKDFSQMAVLKYVLGKLLNDYKSWFSNIDYGKLSFFMDKDVNWIRVNTLFITIVNKKEEPNIIPEKLLNALINWQPTPHQLVMSKMRAQMDDYGIHAESGVMRDRLLQAGWLSQFYLDHADDRALSWKNNIRYHWLALGDKVREKMCSFSDSVSSYLEMMGREAVFSRFYMNEFEEKNICLRMNSFNSFKPHIDDAHLMTGHVLKIVGDELWVCMSPACDLVPGQKNSGRFKKMGNMMPFIGVKLHKINEGDALKEANSNSHIFMSEEFGNSCYSFHPMGIFSASPHWEVLYAENKGRFNQRGLKLQKVNFNGTSLDVEFFDAQVVSQFRYEYALNFLNRLGGSLSRVGLDYKSFESNPTK